MTSGIRHVPVAGGPAVREAGDTSMFKAVGADTDLAALGDYAPAQAACRMTRCPNLVGSTVDGADQE